MAELTSLLVLPKEVFQKMVEKAVVDPLTHVTSAEVRRILTVSPPGTRTERQVEQLCLHISEILSDMHLPSEMLCVLCKDLTVEKVGAGRHIFLQGDAADKGYIVLNGTVDITRKTFADEVKYDIDAYNMEEGVLVSNYMVRDSATRTIEETRTLYELRQGASFGFRAIAHGDQHRATRTVSALAAPGVDILIEGCDWPDGGGYSD
jgi:CRP-like cAMP-binding protein